MLHITNGDATVERLRAAGVRGEYLPWRDVLHEGPVPDGLTLDELRPVRTRFIATQGWGDYEEVATAFAARDEALARWRAHDEVILWFEHDLYDQLQLLQILDWFAAQDTTPRTLSLLCVDAVPGVTRFIGLGQLRPDQLAALLPARRPVTAELLALARAAWAAYRAPDPTGLVEFLRSDTSALPFLHAALTRHLEQFPATRDGLSRTERQILASVGAGARQPGEIFLAVQNREEAPFLGDSSLWASLYGLGVGPQPALARADSAPLAPPRTGPGQPHGGADFAQQRLLLNATGEALLDGRLDWVELAGIDRWLGGVHLHGTAAWRWDTAARRLAPGGITG